MSRKPEAPVDPLTRFPLPFLPSSNLPPMPAYGDWRYNPEVTNFHHAVFEEAVVEAFGAGGEAARDARVQWSWTSWHHRFHEEWGGLDEHMPNTAVKQYRFAVFGLANFIPDQAIDFSRRTPRVVTPSRRQRELLNRQLVVGNNGVRTRRFLLDFSFENGAAAADPALVTEFLDLVGNQQRPERVQVLTGILLNQTIDPIVTPGIRQVYEYTKKHEMLRPGTPSALGSLIRNEINLAFNPNRLTRVLANRFTALRAAPAT